MFEEQIRRQAICPLLDVVIHPNPFELVVSFADGRVIRHKIDAPLRVFLTTIRDYTITLQTDPTGCTPESIGYFNILGFQVGDRAVVDHHFFIEFSS